MNVTRNYKPSFGRFVKKAHKPLQLAIEDAVDCVYANPDIGEAKVQDLQGVLVHKWRFNRQEYLMAYKPTADASHEQLFGHLKEAQFTAQEAAEYLEVSLSTLRRMVASNKLYPAKTVGRNQFFAASDLKALKHRLR